MDLIQTRYEVPSGDGQGAPIVLDIAAVVQAESRLQEVANVNAHNAAELLATYNDSWLQLNKSVVRLTYERNRAENTHKRTKALVLLDCNDEEMKKRGYTKSSQDIREALVETDPTVTAAKDRLDEIRAVLDYLVGKQKAFENAYTSVKKLVGTTQLPLRPLNDTGRQPLIQDAGADDSIPETFVMPPGFSEPNYR